MRFWWRALTRLRWLCVLGCCAGCVVVVSGTPVPAPTATPAVNLVTRPPADSPTEAGPAAGPTLPPATESPLRIVTATPTETGPAPSAMLPTEPATPTPTATALPTEPPTATAPPGPPPDTTAMPIAITAFSIAPAEVRAGQPVTLTWEAEAQTLTLWRLASDGRLIEPVTVPPTGTLALTVPAEQRGQVVFALVAAAGASTAQAVVAARVLCPVDWFFANGPVECPGGAARGTGMAAERFERGLMLWTELDDRIYILYGDGADPAWHSASNAWFEGQPLDDPALVPPAGYFQPIRGFGLAWRTGPATGNLSPRDRLGWGTEPEAGLTGGQVQCAEPPNAERCYFTGPGGRVYVLEPQGAAWRIQP